MKVNRNRTDNVIGAVLLAGLLVLPLPCTAASPDGAGPELPGGQISRIAFGSCAKQWQHQVIWDAVIEAKPDLWLFLGDAVYADTDGKTAWLVTEKQLAGEWNRLADKPEFQKARAAIPMLATWDNHDYGSHAGGVEFPVKESSKRIFLDFFGEPADSERRRTPGIYDAKIFGSIGQRVQIILLDTRFFKDPYTKDPRSKEERLKAGKVGGYAHDNDPAKTLLGKEQWSWLEEQLKMPAEVRFIASSIQVIPDQKGMDEWGNFPRERQRLFDLIESSGAEGVILLSGNVHFAELSKISTGGYPLYELTSSGMTHINEVYAKAANDYRVAGPYTGLNFGMAEIDWEANPSPVITLKAIGADGATAFSHPVRLDDLKAGKDTVKQEMIICTEPRPQICTMDYRSVCAQLGDGTYKTYSNGCTACTDLAVTGYRDGECEISSNQ